MASKFERMMEFAPILGQWFHFFKNKIELFQMMFQKEIPVVFGFKLGSLKRMRKY